MTDADHLEDGHPDEHCTGCGRPLGTCAGCRRPLDPPRHCPHCGRRLRVVVTPTEVTATCRHHGPVPVAGVE